MGVYTSNRTSSLNDIEFPADESYVGELGSYRAMIENAQNDQALFDAILINDFSETAMVQKEGAVLEGAEVEAVQEELIAFREASVKSIADRVIAFIKTVAAKVKGIIMSFITKIGATLTRDNKALVKKYASKLTGKDYSKFKYKWNAPKNESGLLNCISEAVTDTSVQLSVMVGNIVIKKEENLTFDSDYKDDKLSKASKLSNTSFSSYKKDSFEAHFDDKETVEGISDGTLTSIKNFLLGCDKALSGAKASVPKIDKAFNDAIKAAKKAEGVASGNAKLDGEEEDSQTADVAKIKMNYGKGSNTSSSKAAKVLANIQKAVSVAHNVFTTMSGTAISEFKFHTSQCRRVFIQAATYNPRKSTEENALFLDALGESVEYEFESDMLLEEM